MALRLLALTFAAGLTLLAPPGSLAAKGPKPALCPGGSFRVTGGTLLGGTPEVITISNSQLSVVGICPAVSVRPKAR